MSLETDWKEGYLNNVWHKYKTIFSKEGDLYIFAKYDDGSEPRLFKLDKKVVEDNVGKDLNEIFSKAEEVK